MGCGDWQNASLEIKAMEMKLITNQSEGSFEVYVERCRNRKMHPNWRRTLELTVELVDFIKTEVVSHMAWTHLVKNNIWYGRKNEILLTAQIIEEGFRFEYYPSLEEDKHIVIKDREKAKAFLEEFFSEK